jgi:rhodanese-related sulfurtransferase
MFGKVLNLPFKVLGGVARAVQAQEAKKWTGSETKDTAAANENSAITITVPDDFQTGPIRINSAEAIALSENGCVIDVSEAAHPTHGSIPGSLCIPRDEIGIRIAELPPDTHMIVIAHNIDDSDTVVRFLRHRGIDETWSLEGGYKAWVEAGGDVRKEQ